MPPPLHSPVHNGGEPESWNDAEIKAMPGVIGTVKLPNGVAVVADHFEQAMAARRAQGDLEARRRPPASTPSRRSKDYVKVHHDPNAQATELEEGRRQGGVRRRGQDLQGRVPQRLRLSRADGAAERGGAHQRRGRPGRGLGGQPGARRLAQGGGQGARPQGRAGHDPPVLHGRRLRPALARRLRGRVRAHRQGGRAARSS